MSTVKTRTVTDSMFRVTSFNCGVSSLRNTRSVAMVMALAVSRAMRRLASAADRPQSSLRYSTSASSSLPSFSSSVRAIINWARDASSVLGYLVASWRHWLSAASHFSSA